jgi:succinate-acetate transporter protein
MSDQTSTIKVQSVMSNPAALGLFGLAMVTLVASSQKLGWTGGDAKSVALIIPWAIFLGAVAQLIAGVIEFKLNNIFGATAFCGYGLFWMGVAMTWLIKYYNLFGADAAAKVDMKQFAFAFVGYLIFTIYMTVGSMSTSKVLFVIFFLIDMLFIFLAIATFKTTATWAGKAAGWVELAIAIASFYGSAAVVLNTHTGKTVVPPGKPFGPWAPKEEPAIKGKDVVYEGTPADATVPTSRES